MAPERLRQAPGHSAATGMSAYTISCQSQSDRPGIDTNKGPSRLNQLRHRPR
jgi:hypothetical protein